MCYCCARRNMLPMNCNCVRPGVCRSCLKCTKHCTCSPRRNRASVKARAALRPRANAS